jgi:hypothetical protein
MVQINFALKEVNCKVVFYGPGKSGKTTNLEMVHKNAPANAKGELTSIATEGDRTLFFDFMPLDLGTIAGMKTKFQLYTVPGQVIYNTTRQLVLRSVDGIVFVADSQWDKMEENIESFRNLEDNLAKQNLKIDDVPYLLQFNKRDLPRIAPTHYLNYLLNNRKVRVPSFEACATSGKGVFDTLNMISRLVLLKFTKESEQQNAASAAAKRPAIRPLASTHA